MLKGFYIVVSWLFQGCLHGVLNKFSEIQIVLSFRRNKIFGMINHIFLRGKYIAMIKTCFCITINCNYFRAQLFFLSFHMNDIFGSIKHVFAFQLVVFISEHSFVSLSFYVNDSFGNIKRVFLDASASL